MFSCCEVPSSSRPVVLRARPTDCKQAAVACKKARPTTTPPALRTDAQTQTESPAAGVLSSRQVVPAKARPPTSLLLQLLDSQVAAACSLPSGRGTSSSSSNTPVVQVIDDDVSSSPVVPVSTPSEDVAMSHSYIPLPTCLNSLVVSESNVGRRSQGIAEVQSSPAAAQKSAAVGKQFPEAVVVVQ